MYLSMNTWFLIGGGGRGAHSAMSRNDLDFEFKLKVFVITKAAIKNKDIF